MNPEMIDRIEEAIAPLAEAAGLGAEYAWATLIRQAVISGLSLLVAGIIAATITGAFAVAALRCYRRWQKMDERNPSWHERESAGFALGAFIVATLIGLTVTLGLLHGAVARLLNPGFYALDALARVVGA